VQFLRAEGGGYWTGANFDDEAFHLDGELYPVEQPTWNSAAVVLAANALTGTGPTAGLFRGERLPRASTPTSSSPPASRSPKSADARKSLTPPPHVLASPDSPE
jgi:hypothetical protein